MRAITADHARFTDAIYSFRPEHAATDAKSYHTHILSSFDWEIPCVTSRFKMESSESVLLAGPRKGIIIPIEFTGGLGMPNDGLYAGQALSALLTQITERPIVSPRNQYVVVGNGGPLRDEQKIELAIQFPVVFAGPGANATKVPIERQQVWAEKLHYLTHLLLSLDYKMYVELLRAIRLFQLAVTLKRTDFDLAFSLLIASIEAMATLTVSRESGDPELYYSDTELRIQEFCNTSGDELKKWFDTSIKQQAKLKGRFTAYLRQYAPKDAWDEVRHPQQDMLDLSAAYGSTIDSGWVTRKTAFEYYPSDLTDEQLIKIIRKTYDYRSGFVHKGQATPHKHPLSHDRFFEEVTEFKKDKVKTELVLTFDALVTVARISFFNALSVIEQQSSRQ